VILKSGSLVIQTGTIRKLQYGGRLVFQTGSSYIISAVDKDASTKFGLLIEFDLQMRVTSSNMKSEVVWSRRGRNLEITYYVITPPRMDRFGRNLVI